MQVKALVNTEGDAAVDSGLVAMFSKRCGDCGRGILFTTYDDGLCQFCREVNDEILLSLSAAEATRLVDRIEGLFPHMTGGQVLSMAANMARAERMAS